MRFYYRHMTKKISSVSLDEELVQWLDGEIEMKRFSSVSHACAYALEKLRREEMVSA